VSNEEALKAILKSQDDLFRSIFSNQRLLFKNEISLKNSMKFPDFLFEAEKIMQIIRENPSSLQKQIAIEGHKIAGRLGTIDGEASGWMADMPIEYFNYPAWIRPFLKAGMVEKNKEYQKTRPWKAPKIPQKPNQRPFIWKTKVWYLASLHDYLRDRGIRLSFPEMAKYFQDTTGKPISAKSLTKNSRGDLPEEILNDLKSMYETNVFNGTKNRQLYIELEPDWWARLLVAEGLATENESNDSKRRKYTFRGSFRVLNEIHGLLKKTKWSMQYQEIADLFEDSEGNYLSYESIKNNTGTLPTLPTKLADAIKHQDLKQT
jgi:hypothetical protein